MLDKKKSTFLLTFLLRSKLFSYVQYLEYSSLMEQVSLRIIVENKDMSFLEKQSKPWRRLDARGGGGGRGAPSRAFMQYSLP